MKNNNALLLKKLRSKTVMFQYPGLTMTWDKRLILLTQARLVLNAVILNVITVTRKHIFSAEGIVVINPMMTVYEL